MKRKSSLSLPLPQPSSRPLLALGSPSQRGRRRGGGRHTPPRSHTYALLRKTPESGFLPRMSAHPRTRTVTQAAFCWLLRGFLPCPEGLSSPCPIKESFHQVEQRQPPASARSFSAQSSLPPRCGHYIQSPLGSPISSLCVYVLIFFS